MAATTSTRELPRPGFDETHEAFRAAVRAFVNREIVPSPQRRWARCG